MPELYGNPRKSELRSEISKLRSDLAEAQSENRKLRNALDWAQAARTELQLKIDRMEAITKEALAIASVDISKLIPERMATERRVRRAAALAEFQENTE